jgi:hypothetical protein
MEPQAGQQPTPDQGSDNSDTQICNETVAGTANDVAAKPPRDQADNQDYKDTFVRHSPSPQPLDAPT